MCRLRALLLVLLLSAAAVAVSLSPAARAEQQAGVRVVASGLLNPRGLAWDDDGTLLVAEAGTGGTMPGDGSESVPPPLGPFKGGPTARVSRIVDGCPRPLVTGLPSYVTSTGEIGGVADLAAIDGAIYALVTGGGAAHGNPDRPNGLYRVETDGTVSLIADLTAWLKAHPVAHPPQGGYDPSGSFFDMVAAPDGRSVLVVESNSRQVLRVTLDGAVTRIADLSGDNQAPTAITLDAGGTIYVGYLSGVPYPDGAARVVAIGDDGAIEEVWTGLTTVTGLAFGPDGTLYALEMSTGNTAEPPFLTRQSGRLVRQTGPDSAEPVATGLDLPVSLAIGPDGAFYVSLPAVGAEDGSGMVVRIVPGDASLAVGTAALEARCRAETRGGSQSEQGVTIEIYDFGFSPKRVEITAGIAVTWVNTGAVEHTTVSFRGSRKVWDSDIMRPGDRFTFTFERPGTYDYLCGLHPDMKGKIEVVE
jgi:plastocyanin/sugar lactone lactonase YvrE